MGGNSQLALLTSMASEANELSHLGKATGEDISPAFLPDKPHCCLLWDASQEDQGIQTRSKPLSCAERSREMTLLPGIQGKNDPEALETDPKRRGCCFVLCLCISQRGFDPKLLLSYSKPVAQSIMLQKELQRFFPFLRWGN